MWFVHQPRNIDGAIDGQRYPCKTHPHGYIYKMYSEFLREQGKTKQGEETLKLWDFSPAFREYKSLDISTAAEMAFALTG